MTDQVTPKFVVSLDGIKIDIKVPQTDSTLGDQGYTYNQAGLTYNQAGVMYGGINNASMDIPMFFNAQSMIEKPLIQGITNLSATSFIEIQEENIQPLIYSFEEIGVTIASHQSVVGPGWFMYVSK